MWEVNQTAMGEEMQRTCAALRVESFYTLPTAEDTGVVYCGEIGERTNARWRLNRIKAEMSQSRSMYQSSELVVSLVAVLSGDASDAALHPLPSSADGRSTPNAYALGTLEVLVAERLPGEALAGDTPEGRAYLFNLCVCPRARRRGVGSQLLSRAVARASRLGVRFLYVHVERQNTAARHLYARHGFVQCNALDGKLLLVLKMI